LPETSQVYLPEKAKAKQNRLFNSILKDYGGKAIPEKDDLLNGG